MARIPYVPEESDDPQVTELLEWVTEVEGQVPNHFRLELHFPEHFKAWLTWVRVLWDEGELTFEEVQHVGIAVSKANECAYCAGSFCAVLEHGGEVDRGAVEDYMRRGIATLDARGRVLVEFAVKADLSPHEVTQADVDRLREVGLTERGIVQLVWLVNMFASSNRLNTVLGTDADAANDYQALARELLAGTPESGSSSHER
jgi:uncharacterized peroxidase-related enzyme